MLPLRILRSTLRILGALAVAGVILFAPLAAAEAKKKTAPAPNPHAPWIVRHNHPSAGDVLAVTTKAKGFEVLAKATDTGADDTYVFLHLKLDGAISALTFDHAVQGEAARMPIVLFDAAANELWRFDGAGRPPGRVELKNLRVRGQIVFRVRRDRGHALIEGWSHRISNLAFTADARAPVVAPDGFTLVESLDELRGYANQDGAKVRLKPGVYQLDRAHFRHFIEITGRDSQWDLRGVTLRVDTKLFSQFGSGPSPVSPFYTVFSLTAARIRFEGLTTENFGDQPGVHSRNKIFNITGTGVVLRNVEITTSGSSPWGYGSLFGIAGPDVRKMNGIRVGAPARDVIIQGCRVHMRAFGHGIFVQGAQNTLIQDCHVDGLLKPTREILAQKSGYAFDRKFNARGRNYIEGVTVGANGRILADEMVALSEDGIRLYDQAGPGRLTGSTKIVGCTVTRMRRGICTGLGPAADMILNCEVRECVAAGYNVGTDDVIRSSRADAKYAEAVAVPDVGAKNADVDVEILDTRGGLANALLAVVNGEGHRVAFRTKDGAFVPASFAIELATRNGHAFYQKSEPTTTGVTLVNLTPATVVLPRAAAGNDITSQGAIRDLADREPRNSVRQP